jgi:DNA-binding CsgD family transcriptional regulator
MGLVGDGESPQRARVLAHHARAQALRGHYAEALAGAEEALVIAERVDDAEIRSRCLNTLGFSRAALGEVDAGVALLRRARDLAAEVGPPVVFVQAVTNLSELLDLSGRTEEALAEARAGAAVVRQHPERTSYDTFLEVQGVNQLIRLGRLAELEDGLPAAKFGDEAGTTPIFLHELRARVALIGGDLPRARTELDELRRLSRGTLDPQWMEPLFGLSAQLALLEDRHDDARAAVAQGLAAIDGAEDGARAVRLHWTGLMAEASAAERARALGEPYDPAHADALEAGLLAAEAMPGQWAEGSLYATLARAELARLRHATGAGPPDPEAFTGAAAGFAALSYPWPAAYAGFRAAEAHVQSGDRAAAVEPLRAARAHAAATGATPLLNEIDALARRARLALAAPEEPAAPESGDWPTDAAGQLGLTPREHEVLLLVAAGRTNREIGAELFMSEKTASVHVSRILAKLGVGGRVEAAAVAHRLGLTGSAASV